MSKMGTIIYVGAFELPDKNAAAHLVLNNARLFTKLGYRVIFCGISRQLPSGTKGINEKIDLYESFPRPYPRNLLEWFFDYDNFKTVFGKYKDVKMIIAYNCHSVQMAKIINYCRKKKIFVISNLTEWYENKFSINPVQFIKFLDTVLVMRFLNKKVDGIIADSSYLEKYYHDYVDNIIVMPPLVNVRDPKWSKNKYVPGSKIRFIYSGSPEKKGSKDKLLPIIRCFCRLSNYEFIFMVLGLTKEQFLVQYPEMKECLKKVDNKIIFYGKVPHAESVARLFESDFSIFIRDHTRKNDAGFPTKFVEGYTSGINIIASNISDIEKYFPKDDMSILLNDNSEELIEKVLEDILKQSIADISRNRRDGLNDNPFQYDRWIDEMSGFLSNLKHIP